MKKLYLTTAIALLASPVLADITPAALWQSWQDDFASVGVMLTAEQAVEGNVLVLRNMKFEIETGFFRLDETLAEMRLQALADGSVSMDYSSSLTMSMDMGFTDGIRQSLTSTGEMKNATGLITGSIDDYIMDFTIGEMVQDGDSSGTLNGDASSNGTMHMSISDMTGREHVAHTDSGVSFTYDFTAGNMETAQTTSGQDYGSGETIQTSKTVLQGYEGQISAFFPTARPVQGGGSFIPEGFLLDASLAMLGAKTEQSTDSPFFKMKMNGTEDESHYLLNVNESSIGIQFDSQNAAVNVSAPQFGNAPLGAAFEAIKLAGSLPLRPGDSPQDARYELRLGGVTLNDAVWAMADPASTLSHAPADLAIDMRASVTLLLDWTDFEAAKAMQGPFAILHNVKLQDFLIAFENARLTGVGTVGFSNEGPVPVPNGGMLNFSFEGVNALLDKLGNLPLLDPSLTMGAKGMLGAFTSSGEGPDSLTSVVEFSEGGHVSINGQQVR